MKKNNLTSKYKGVCWHKGSVYKGKRYKSKWRAAICKDGKRITLGHFHSEIEAAIAYNKVAKELYGEFAKLNEVA